MKTNESTNATSYTPDSDASAEMTKAEDAALAAAKADKCVVSITALNKVHELLDYLDESSEWKETVAMYRDLLPAKVV